MEADFYWKLFYHQDDDDEDDDELFLRNCWRTKGRKDESLISSRDYC